MYLDPGAATSGDGASGTPALLMLPRFVLSPAWFVADGVTCTEAWPYEPAAPRTFPFVDGGAVPAGFPSPADDFDESCLDLGDLLVSNPDATFFIRAQGRSMRKAGILSGDILVVDRSAEPKVGRIIIAVLDGEMTVKRLGRIGGRFALLAEPDAEDVDAYPPTIIPPGSDLSVWGVVTGMVRADIA